MNDSSNNRCAEENGPELHVGLVDSINMKLAAVVLDESKLQACWRKAAVGTFYVLPM